MRIDKHAKNVTSIEMNCSALQAKFEYKNLCRFRSLLR